MILGYNRSGMAKERLSHLQKWILMAVYEHNYLYGFHFKKGYQVMHHGYSRESIYTDYYGIEYLHYWKAAKAKRVERRRRMKSAVVATGISLKGLVAKELIYTWHNQNDAENMNVTEKGFYKAVELKKNQKED